MGHTHSSEDTAIKAFSQHFSLSVAMTTTEKKKTFL